MKNLKKTIAAGLAMAMALSANVGVFAAEFTASYNDALTEIAVDNITTNENFNAGEQYTVIIGEKSAMAAGSIADASILYINQGTTSEEFWGEMATKTTLEVGKTYTVRIGGENLSSVYEVDIEITSDGITILWGDVDQSGSVSVTDASAVVNSLVGGKKTYGNYTIGVEYATGYVWGDVDVSGSVSATDASAVVNSLIGGKKTYGNYTIGVESEVK